MMIIRKESASNNLAPGESHLSFFLGRQTSHVLPHHQAIVELPQELRRLQNKHHQRVIGGGVSGLGSVFRHTSASTAGGANHVVLSKTVFGRLALSRVR